jgi:hypothetical protein
MNFVKEALQMKKNILAFPILISILAILAGPAIAEAKKEGGAGKDSDKIKVFIVQSYEKDHVCGAPRAHHCPDRPCHGRGSGAVPGSRDG